MNNYNPLEPLGIQMSQVRRYESAIDDDTAYFFVEIVADQRTCPNCGTEGARIKEYKTKTVRGPRSQGLRTIVECKLPRYVCRSCGKTYTHNLSASEKGLSRSQVESIIADFYKTLTFKEIAERHDVSATTVINIFDEKAPNLRQRPGRCICIDEYSNTRKSTEKYSCILVDFETRKIIDILPSRTTPYLDEYFSKQPKIAMESIEFVVTDMYDGYISAATRHMRNAIIAIDPFHWMEYLTEAVQNIRRDLEERGEQLSDSAWMGKHWRMLTMPPERLPKDPMTTRYGMTISYRDRVLAYARQDQDLLYAYVLLQDFYQAARKWDKSEKRYDWVPYEKARTLIPFYVNQMLKSGIQRLESCGRTWNHYLEYITNSFIQIGGRRLSNGPVEGINSRVKTLKKLYCGYRNKKRFSERIIMIVNNEK